MHVHFVGMCSITDLCYSFFFSVPVFVGSWVAFLLLLFCFAVFPHISGFSWCLFLSEKEAVLKMTACTLYISKDS